MSFGAGLFICYVGEIWILSSGGSREGAVDSDEKPAISLKIKLRQTIIGISKAWITDRLVRRSPEGPLLCSRPRGGISLECSRAAFPQSVPPGRPCRAGIFFQNRRPCPCLGLAWACLCRLWALSGPPGGAWSYPCTCLSWWPGTLSGAAGGTPVSLMPLVLGRSSQVASELCRDQPTESLGG